MKKRPLQIASREVCLVEETLDKTRVTNRAIEEWRLLELQRREVAGVDKALLERDPKKIDVAFGKIDTDKLTLLEGHLTHPATGDERKTQFRVIEDAITQESAGEIHSNESATHKSTVGKGFSGPRGILELNRLKCLVGIFRQLEWVHA